MPDLAVTRRRALLFLPTKRLASTSAPTHRSARPRSPGLAAGLALQPSGPAAAVR